MPRSLLIAIVVGLAWSPAVAIGADLYRASKVWTGKEVIENGAMLVVDGKIVAVGPRDKVASPAGATIHELGSSVIIPGLIAADTQAADPGRDDERTIVTEIRGVDGIDFFADNSRLLAAGITTIQATPGGRRLVGGQGTVVKLAGSTDRRIVRATESLSIVLTKASRNPPTIYEPPVGAVSEDRPLEPTKKQPGETLAGAVAAVRGLLRAAKAPKADDALVAAAAPYLAPDGTIRIAAENAGEVRAALRLAQEYQFNLLLVGPQDCSPLTAALPAWKGRGIGVVLSLPSTPNEVTNRPLPSPEEPKTKDTWETAADLAKAGIAFAISPSRGGAEDFLFEAGLFQRGGLDELQTLRAITLTAAELLGVQKAVGSLEAGKDADFVVMSDSPFALAPRIERTFIDGAVVYDRSKAAPTTVVRADKLYAPSPVGNGRTTIVVRGGKISGVSSTTGSASIPEDVSVIDFPPGSTIVPGFIDLSTSIGLDGSPGAIAMGTKIAERLTPSDPAIHAARKSGIATVLLSGTGDGPKPVIAFKLSDDVRVVKEPVAIEFGVGSNLTTEGDRIRGAMKSAKTYHDTWLKYESDLAEYEKKKKEYDEAKAKKEAAKKPEPKASEEKKPAEQPAPKKDAPKSFASGEEEETQTPPEKKKEPEGEKKPPEESKKAEADPNEPKAPTKLTVSATLEPYRDVFRGKLPILVSAKRWDGIQLALKIFRDEFNVRTILSDADDAFRDPEVLAEKNVAFAVGPQLVRKVDYQTVNLPVTLAMRGLPFGFQSKSGSGSRQLPDAVQYSVRRGLGTSDALAGLTSSPATFLGLSNSGVIAKGKDADLVVLSGPPFALATKVLAVMIDGKWVYRAEEKK